MADSMTDKWSNLPPSSRVEDRRYGLTDTLASLWAKYRRPVASPDMITQDEWQSLEWLRQPHGYAKQNQLANSAGLDILQRLAADEQMRDLRTMPHRDTIDFSDPNSPPVGWQKLLGR